MVMVDLVPPTPSCSCPAREWAILLHFLKTVTIRISRNFATIGVDISKLNGGVIFERMRCVHCISAAVCSGDPLSTWKKKKKM